MTLAESACDEHTASDFGLHTASSAQRVSMLSCLSITCAGPPPEKLLPATTVDREKTCPLLLRVFPKRGGHHKCVQGKGVCGVHDSSGDVCVLALSVCTTTSALCSAASIHPDLDSSKHQQLRWAAVAARGVDRLLLRCSSCRAKIQGPKHSTAWHNIR